MVEFPKERARKKILVVEDENPIQKLLIDILEEATYNVQIVVLSQYSHLLEQTPQVKAVIGKPFDIVDLLIQLNLD